MNSVTVTTGTAAGKTFGKKKNTWKPSHFGLSATLTNWLLKLQKPKTQREQLYVLYVCELQSGLRIIYFTFTVYVYVRLLSKTFNPDCLKLNISLEATSIVNFQYAKNVGVFFVQFEKQNPFKLNLKIVKDQNKVWGFMGGMLPAGHEFETSALNMLKKKQTKSDPKVR